VRVCNVMYVLDWIAAVPGNPLKIECIYCEVQLNANAKELTRHGNTSKHARNMALHSGSAELSTMSPVKVRKSTTDGVYLSLFICGFSQVANAFESYSVI